MWPIETIKATFLYVLQLLNLKIQKKKKKKRTYAFFIYQHFHFHIVAIPLLGTLQGQVVLVSVTALSAQPLMVLTHFLHCCADIVADKHSIVTYTNRIVVFKCLMVFDCYAFN